MSAVPMWLRVLASLDEESIAMVLRRLPDPVVRRLFEEWSWQAHGGQREPGGEWRVWLLMAGRGFGKTMAGAQWVSEMARRHPGARIALVGASLGEVERVMVEGEGGILEAVRTGETLSWVPTRRTLTFGSGAQAVTFSGEDGDALRGAQHHFAWCDELAKWPDAEGAWSNLQLGLRLGERPRAMVTTTPRPMALLRALRDDAGTEVTRGRTADNPHVAERFGRAVQALYGGTRLGRQELEGELIEDAEGSLWPRALIEAARVEPAPAREALARVVVAVDPPASSGGDACGIVAAGLGRDGKGYVLGDHSVEGASPEGWARKVAGAVEAWRADRVVAEANNGGEMVSSVLRAAGLALPVRLVHASVGKTARAEPVATLFESGRAKLAGRFPGLEDELAGLTLAGGYEGPRGSPDRADAMVWALTELMLGPVAPVPRIRSL